MIVTQNISISQQLIAEAEKRAQQRPLAPADSDDSQWTQRLDELFASHPETGPDRRTLDHQQADAVAPASDCHGARRSQAKTNTRAGKLTPRQRQVLALLDDGEWHESHDLADTLGLRSKAGLTSLLRNLQSAGMVEDERVGPRRNWYDERRWRLVPAEDRARITAAGTEVWIWRSIHNAAAHPDIRVRACALKDNADGPIVEGTVTSVDDSGFVMVADDGSEHQFSWPAMTAAIEQETRR